MICRIEYYPMKPIPPEIKILYDAALVKKGVPLSAHFHYRKWLRYYWIFVLYIIAKRQIRKVLRRLFKN